MSEQTSLLALPPTAASGLTVEQQRAVDLVMSAPERIAVLTGGPGVGKTFTLSTILDEADGRGWSVALASPTGKAAKRASEVTGRPASTLHRLLAYHPDFGFQKNAQTPLDADLVVIDETSMVDVELFAALLRAVAPPTRVLLVGDDDQLPSVGAGSVLRSVIASGVAPVARLTQVMRQDERSWIHRNAQRINRGERPLIDNEACDDFLWVEVEDAREIPDRVRRLITETFPAVFPTRPSTGRPYDPIDDVQVLAPQKNGGAGVNVLNDTLREALNPALPAGATPATPPAPELRIGRGAEEGGGVCYRLGDKVLQNRNNYDLGVFNGEGGVVVAVDQTGGRLAVDFGIEGGPREYERRNLVGEGGRLELLPAWAISIHKSQGSEFPVVVVVCHSTHSFMLTRQILYTAITRAREKVFVVGDEKGLDRAVRNDAPVRRYTALGQRLRGEIA